MAFFQTASSLNSQRSTNEIIDSNQVINIVNNIDDKVSVVNNIQYKNYKTLFTDISYLVTNDEEHNLNNIFSHQITTTKTKANVFVNFNFSYKCSYGFQERITINIYRDQTKIYTDSNLGSQNFTGGLIGKYSITFIDNLSKISTFKYYIRFKLENNISQEPQGIYNFNSITLIEY